MHELSARLLKNIRKQELIKPGDRVAVAVSGGADSVALLHLLLELRAELGIVLLVAHVNHKLRGEESDKDERFVADLCRAYGLELHCCARPLSDTRGLGIEAAARELRYGFFRQLAGENCVSKIATAHTLDDQAETVLLRILRGTGIRGLAGIHPCFIFEEQGHKFGEVVRPLLGFRRADLEDFLRERGQLWRDDATNRDPTFLRNRVRHTVLPALEENFGSSVAENLADLAEIARAEEEHWNETHPEIRLWAGATANAESGPPIQISVLLSLPVAARRRLIRRWLEIHASGAAVSFHLIEKVLELAHSPAGKALELSAGYSVRRARDYLCLELSDDADRADEYEYPLSIPGEVKIPELGICLNAALVSKENIPGAEHDSLLDPQRLPRALTVRNWRPGDRFWPAHTKEPRKVKELLSERHLTGSEKKLWPVIVACGEVVWMRGFPVRADFHPDLNAKQALCIREIPAK